MIAKSTQRPAMTPTSAHGQILQRVSPSEESLFWKKLTMHWLFAWSWRVADIPIQAAPTPKAARVTIEWRVR